MDFATLFRLEENLNLDKKTLVFLRWIAIFGQLFSINLVYFFLNLDFPVLICHSVIILGLLSNVFLQFKIKASLLKDLYSSSFLVLDIFLLSVLLFLTGGIFNPFSILIIVPTIVSSTFLSMGSTIILGSITIFLLSTNSGVIDPTLYLFKTFLIKSFTEVVIANPDLGFIPINTYF